MTDAQIKTIVSANTADFEKGLLRMSRQLGNFEKQQRATNQKLDSSFKSISASAGKFIGTIAGTVVTSYLRSVVDAAGAMKDLSLQTGIAASTFSALRAPLETTGSSVEELAGSISKLQKNISEAASGGSDALVGTFNELGISIEKLRQLTPEQQFNEVVKALAKVKDQSDFTRLGMELFGKSFRGLAPAIRETNGELSDYARRQQEAGNALTNSEIDKLDEYGDALTRLSITLANFSARRFLDVMAAIEAAMTAVGLVTIETQRSLGLIDKETADAAILEGRGRISDLNKRGVDTPATPTGSNVSGRNATGGGAKEAAKNAERLQEALNQMQRETSRDVYTAPFNELDKKLKEVKFTIEDMARQYKTKLTPEQLKQIETIQENITTYDRLQKEQEDSKRLADELGGAFRDAFADAVLGAESFSDVLGALSKRLQQIAFNKFVGDPLSKAADSIFGKLGGSLFGELPSFSFATGIKNVPYDMNARLHKGEQVVTRQGVDAMQRNGGSGSGGNIYNIDARGADQGAVARVERSLIALAGPGVIERRVTNAQTRGTL